MTMAVVWVRLCVRGESQIFDAGKSSSNSCIHQRVGVILGRTPVRPSQALLQDFG